MMTEPSTNPAEPPECLEVYRLASAESRTAFEDLMAQPGKIRRNVGALLGFAAVAVTLLGAFPPRPPGWAAGACQVAAVAGVVGLVVCTAVLTAPKKLVPSMRADRIVGWGDAGDSEAAVVKSLALGIEENYRKNAVMIETMSKWQIAATICFGVTVIMLAARVRSLMSEEKPQQPQQPPPQEPSPQEPPPARPNPAREPEYRNDPRPPRRP